MASLIHNSLAHATIPTSTVPGAGLVSLDKLVQKPIVRRPAHPLGDVLAQTFIRDTIDGRPPQRIDTGDTRPVLRFAPTDRNSAPPLSLIENSNLCLAARDSNMCIHVWVLARDQKRNESKQ